MEGKSWYINDLTSLPFTIWLTASFCSSFNLIWVLFVFASAKYIAQSPQCSNLIPRIIAVAKFLRSNTYAVRPSLCVGIPLQLNSLSQGILVPRASRPHTEPELQENLH
jgi:hypothetical protein